MPADRETGRPRGFAFVQFSTPAEAAEAIRSFNGREVGGRKLNLNAAEERPRRTEGPRPARPAAAPSFAAPERSFDDDFSSDPFGRQKRPFKNKGSRRGLRARKRSLSF